MDKYHNYGIRALHYRFTVRYIPKNQRELPVSAILFDFLFQITRASRSHRRVHRCPRCPAPSARHAHGILQNPLLFHSVPVIINLKNKNAAACGCANTHKPAQVLDPPTQRPKGRTAWDIIQQSGLSCKGWFLLSYPFAFVLHENFASYAV